MQRIKADKDRAVNLVNELEQQLSTAYDQQAASKSRLPILNINQSQTANEASATRASLDQDLEVPQASFERLQVKNFLQKNCPTSNNNVQRQNAQSREPKPESYHVRQMEKHLFAEQQLTATLEEALVDLEDQGGKIKLEMEDWKKRTWAYEEELSQLKREKMNRAYDDELSQLKTALSLSIKIVTAGWISMEVTCYLCALGCARLASIGLRSGLITLSNVCRA